MIIYNFFQCYFVKNKLFLIVRQNIIVDMSSSSNSEDQENTSKPYSDCITKEITLKVLIMGDCGVGKTAIVRQYVEGRFSSNYKTTIGADFTIKTVTWDNNTQLNVQLWDIAGNERFTAMTRVYYRYATAAALVFDVSRISTFTSVYKWLSFLREKITHSDGSPIPVIVMANKCDIFDSSVPSEALDKMCKDFKVRNWYLTSAKNNQNIDEAMMFLISCAMEDKLKEVQLDNDSIVLTSENDFLIKSKSCCS